MTTNFRNLFILYQELHSTHNNKDRRELVKAIDAAKKLLDWKECDNAYFQAGRAIVSAHSYAIANQGL